MGFLMTNNLATLLLDGKRATKAGSHWFLEGERISGTDARARACEQKNLDHITFLKANE